jgi:hypothetical protein
MCEEDEAKRTIGKRTARSCSSTSPKPDRYSSPPGPTHPANAQSAPSASLGCSGCLHRRSPSRARADGSPLADAYRLEDVRYLGGGVCVGWIGRGSRNRGCQRGRGRGESRLKRRGERNGRRIVWRISESKRVSISNWVGRRNAEWD